MNALLNLFVPIVLLCAVALEIYGFRSGQLFAQQIWIPVGLKRYTRFIGEFLAFSFPLLLMAPWSYPVAITGLAAVGTVFSVGPLPVIAVLYYLISCCALGSLLLGRRREDDLEAQILATLTGMAIWIFAMYFIVRLPIHYTVTWAVLLAIPIALDLEAVRRRLRALWDALLRLDLDCPWERAAFAVLVFFLLANWFVALTPESSADGLAMHLAIPIDIATHHRLTFEPSRFLWAVMPIGTDFTYAIQYLLGGEYASHLIDFSLLLMLVALIYRASRRWLSRASAFLLAALFTSTPLVYLASGSLFVEHAVALLVLGFMTAVWRYHETGDRRYLFLAALLGGSAVSSKLGAVAFIGLGLPFLYRRKSALKPALLAILILLAFALPPYITAYVKSGGNPIFPYHSARFPSTLIPAQADIVDARFDHPLTWQTPIDLTFHTHLTYEGQDGSFGFQYLLLAPMALLALLFLRKRPAASAAFVGLGACIIIMSAQPNGRYLYPALPLLTIAFAAVLGWARQHRWLSRAIFVSLAAAMALNGYFLPSSSYYHKDFCLRLPFSYPERARYRTQMVPIRDVIDYFNQHHRGSTVMLTAEPSVAGLDGVVYEDSWHQYNTLDAIRNARKLPDLMQLMQNWKVEYFIAPKSDVDDGVKHALLRQLLDRCTQLEFEQGDQFLARIESTCRPPKEPPVIYVSRGAYDDFDPALIFRGEWSHSKELTEPDRGTVSWSEEMAAEAQIAFDGTILVYNYTRYKNRGKAEVLIDGESKGEIDAYMPCTVREDQCVAAAGWHTRKEFKLPPGRHIAVVRVTGRANPKSEGHFVDLDSFEVW